MTEPRIQRIIDKETGQLLYELGGYNMNDRPSISVIVHSPSAEDVAAYFNTVVEYIDRATPLDMRIEIAHSLTAIWLQGQMDAAVEMARQNSGPVFKRPPYDDNPVVG